MLPEIVHLHITGACPCNCKHCYLKQKFRDTKLPLETVTHYMQVLQENGAKYLNILGGEPFLHPEFSEILKKATDMFEKVTVSTYGDIFFKRYLEEVMSYDNATIWVSLDYYGSKHDHLRRNPGLFERVHRNLVYAKRYADRITIRSTIFDDNYPDIREILNFAKYYGYAMFCYRSIGYNEPSAKTLEKVYSLFLNENDPGIYQVRDNTFKLINKNLYPWAIKIYEKYGKLCGAGARRISILPNGTVTPCPYWLTYTLGNLEDMENLQRNIKKFIEFSMQIPERCKECPFAEICRGACTILRGRNCPIREGERFKHFFSKNI